MSGGQLGHVTPTTAADATSTIGPDPAPGVELCTLAGVVSVLALTDLGTLRLRSRDGSTVYAETPDTAGARDRLLAQLTVHHGAQRDDLRRLWDAAPPSKPAGFPAGAGDA